jgi:hypothetical protein
MNEQEIKNPTENLETLGKLENPTTKDEMEVLFAKYKAEKLRAIDSAADRALKSGDNKLGAASSFSYSNEQIAKFRAERGIDNLLANNGQQIEQLQADTKAKIANLT